MMYTILLAQINFTQLNNVPEKLNNLSKTFKPASLDGIYMIRCDCHNVTPHEFGS